jgi:hypothetical protein
MHELARARVKTFIAEVPLHCTLFACGPVRFHLIPLQTVPDHLRAQVYEEVRKQHPEIKLPAYGVVQSDGYRSAPIRSQPPPSLENNVTRIMEMGIADRIRALQVCVCDVCDVFVCDVCV